LYLWFCRNLERVIFQGYIEGHPTQQLSLPASSVKPAGFAEEESLLPYPQRSFAGFRLLQEYFTIPSKFLFFDVTGLAPAAALDTGGKFELRFEFKRSPQALPRVAPENFRLFCTPVINLFPHTADPIRLEHDRVEYRIRPASVEARHYEVYSTDRVQGWAEGRVKPKEYAPFYTFTHDIGAGREPVFYLTRLRPSVSSEGTDTFISFVSAQEENVLPEAETISIDLTCANRDLPHHLRIGDISVPTGESPEFAVFQNIVRVTTSIRPPLDRGLHWRLLSHLSLNYISLASPEALRSVLELYNFQALYDRQAARENQLRLEAIQGVRSKPMDWLMKGIPVHGTSVELDLMETNFSGEGDLYLFAAILNEVFALYSSINSFTKLKVRGVKQNEVYEWAPRLGRQILA
jgi:type VI secretion system protein ImpG